MEGIGLAVIKIKMIDLIPHLNSILQVVLSTGISNLKPSFIFDLTTTPRNNSNIISYVDAMRLKKQDMFKLPVILANQRTQEDVINVALKMRHQLEEYAKQDE